MEPVEFAAILSGAVMLARMVPVKLGIRSR